MPSSSSRVTLDVPAALAEPLRAFLDSFDSALSASALSGEPVPFLDIERDLHQRTAALLRESSKAALQALDPGVPLIRVEEKLWKRLSPYPVRVLGLSGEIEVTRALYRQVGVRNGPTVDPVALRAGFVEGCTPAAARAIARLHQALPSREAAALCKELGVLPTSRPTLERTGKNIGTAMQKSAIPFEEEFIESFEIPKQARTLAVSVDRVAIPEFEDREKTEQDDKKGVDHPVQVVWRMGYCGLWSLHDAEGNVLFTRRYAHMAEGGNEAMRMSLGSDVHDLMRKSPDLRLVTLADGAPELQAMLDEIAPKAAYRLLDFWHAVEKLGGGLAALGVKDDSVLKGWKEALLKDDDAISGIEAELKRRGARRRKLPKATEEALTYVKNQKGRMRFASARAAGLPIGSGAVEATCKGVVRMRMRRPGARWQQEGGQAVLQLRSLAVSSEGVWTQAMDHLIASRQRYVATVS